MLDRMNKDLIYLKIETNELQGSLRQKKMIVSDELDKSRKSKEEKLQSKYKLDKLMKNIDLEQKERQERIQSLQKSIKNKEDAVQRRMERVRRQQEIAEAAANENKDSGELKMRENFMVQKLWSVFLKRKMEKEMQDTASIEDAFQKIRSATGLTDVQDIVHKFLTREQTYSQLLVAVAEAEHKIDELKKENEFQSNILHNIMIDKDGETKRLDPEVKNLSDIIFGYSKELESLNERSEKTEITTDQVYGWAQRVLQKMDEQFQDGRVSIQYLSDLEKLKKHATLIELFEKIGEITCDSLQNVIQEEGDEDRYINSKEFMNDFASQEFIDKNIRIRPMSGRTAGEES